MASQLPDYKQLYLEGRQEVERAKEEAEQAKRATRNTNLLEFLDGCHVCLYSSFIVQSMALSTRGDPVNATGKLRPEKIRSWEDFCQLQETIWKDLMDSDFLLERHFSPLLALQDLGTTFRRTLGSEQDLHTFERCTVENQVSTVIQRLYDSPTRRKKFGLKGSIRFENHANTLGLEQQTEDGVQDTSPSKDQPRRSQRLLAKGTKSPGSTTAADLVAAPAAAATRPSRPLADQFCVYHISSETEPRVAAFVVEYKAPHKLSLDVINEGVGDMDLKDVVTCRKTDTTRDHSRRRVAAIITQAFSYMIRAGLEYGYVCTGEAFIFLQVPDDPRTVKYFVSIPKQDVGPETGWTPDSDAENRLLLTAVGQVLAFTLRALKSAPRNQTWQSAKAAKLEAWHLLSGDPDSDEQDDTDDALSPDYQPSSSQGGKDLPRTSPIGLRPKSASGPVSSGCRPLHDSAHSGDDESDPDPSSRPSQKSPSQLPSQAPDPASSAPSDHHHRRGGTSSQYCTQKCLRGLVEGSLLDKLCPNVQDHGTGRHRIDQPTFLDLMRRQLSKDLDTDCQPMGVNGSRGVLFKVRLTSHGYTVAAKCTVSDFVAHLQHEATIYKRLRPVQGIHVPVYLGNMDLDKPYFWEGIAEIVHMMFLSFAGPLVSRHINVENKVYLSQQLGLSMQAIHRLGVLHRDAEPRNMLWNAEVGQVMMIDFERAEIRKRRVVPGAISPDRKRKRVAEAGVDTERRSADDVFARELRSAMFEFGRLVPNGPHEPNGDECAMGHDIEVAALGDSKEMKRGLVVPFRSSRIVIYSSSSAERQQVLPDGGSSFDTA